MNEAQPSETPAESGDALDEAILLIHTQREILQRVARICIGMGFLTTLAFIGTAYLVWSHMEGLRLDTERLHAQSMAERKIVEETLEGAQESAREATEQRMILEQQLKQAQAELKTLRNTRE